jgi:3-methyladenine DNA glycosylase/8-oxoguanine DNA glycosylase
MGAFGDFKSNTYFVKVLYKNRTKCIIKQNKYSPSTHTSAARFCAACGKPLPESVHPARRFCTPEHQKKAKRNRLLKLKKSEYEKENT